MIQMRMAFALRLVDDFTGQCIRKKGFLFSVEGRVIHPVEKDEGLYLFMEPQESVTRVRIESTDYHSCSVLIEKKQLNPDEPVADVRLYGKPGRGRLLQRNPLRSGTPASCSAGWHHPQWK